MIGRTLSHYEILESIGSGGMGDVYLAEDKKLGRKIALKILPAESVTPDRLRRFEQEAKALAALNHPNIVHVYSVEEADGIHFITMEWVRGQPLSASIPRKGLSLSRFLEIAIPLVDAVSAAHEEGIIHRDLKPDNVVLSEDGRVKVLDFGLSKLRGEAKESAASESPTLSVTQEGHVVGTAFYMSPEQAEGKKLDHRTDIFSLGVVLYEMLTGERPFVGDTPGAILSSIIKDVAPSVTDSRPDAPRDVARIVKRCLTKDVGRRFQTAADLRNDLEDLKEALGSGELVEARPERRRPAAWIVAGAAAALAAFVGFLALWGSRDETPMRLTNPVQVTSAVGVEDYPTWSPDGQRLAYHSNQTGNWDIWVTQLGGGDAVSFTIENLGEDQFPSWSPDGRQIAFLSRREGSWGVYTVSALGGAARHWLPLGSESVPRGRPQWSSDGTELAVAFETGDQNVADVLTLSSQNERRIALPRPRGNVALDLSWSPNGETFAFVSAIAPLAEITQIFVVPASGGDAIPVTDGTTNAWHPNWSPDGSSLYFVSNRGGSMDLWEQPIGSGSKPDGEARAVTTGMGLRSAIFSADRSKLAYSVGRTVSNVWRVPLFRDRRATWADAEPITSDNVFTENVKVSLDGSLFISSDRSGNQDLWVRKRDEIAFRQLTFDLALQTGPQVSPDGKRVAFYAFQDGSRDIMVMPAGGGPAQTLAPHPAEDISPSWSPDGSRIVFASRRSGNRDIWVVDSTGGEAKQLTTDVAEELAPFFSPDAKWLYFTSDKAGDLHIWRIPAEGGNAERVSQSVGFTARFSSDGKTLYFTEWPSNAGNIWAKTLEDGIEYPVTDLAGRPGELGWDMDTDGEYLYFTWFNEVGDIWVMDIVTNQSP